MGQILKDEKIIWTPKSKWLEVYNLVQDSQEMAPILVGRSRGPYQPHVNHLLSWFKSTNRRGKNRMATTRRDIEILETLGYID